MKIGSAIASGVLALAALGGCAHAPRPSGPPLELRFAPPPGMVQREQHIQRRAAEVDFPDGPRTRVVEVIESVTEERYEPLPGGGFRVTARILEESSARDGRRVESPLPLAGIPFVHTIDADGVFRSVERAEETLALLRSRLRNGPAKDLLEPTFTPEMLATRMQQAWEARFEGVCRTAIAPGQAIYRLDEQPLPVAGPVISVVEQLATGRVEDRFGESLELRLRLGGRRTSVAAAEGARALVRLLPGGTTALAENLTGEGERIVTAACHTTLEVVRLKGELRLNLDAARLMGAQGGFPERIRYQVDREVRRRPAAAPGAG